MELTKVYTKYDSIPIALKLNYVRKLTPEDLNWPTDIWFDQSGFISERTLHYAGEEEGLEGVKFVTYKGA